MSTIIVVSQQKSIQEYLENILQENHTVLYKKSLDEVKTSQGVVLFFDDRPYEVLSPLLKIERSVSVLLLQSVPNVSDGERFITLGLRGYGNVHMSQTALLQAIGIIESGNIWVYPELMTTIISKKYRKQISNNSKSLSDAHLTVREEEVAHLVAKGMSNKEIATELSISLSTVKLHIHTLFEKLHVKNRVALTLSVNENL
jgi:two-component system, NarL family, nitrate/nitrite response regulator NarL